MMASTTTSALQFENLYPSVASIPESKPDSDMDKSLNDDHTIDTTYNHSMKNGQENSESQQQLAETQQTDEGPVIDIVVNNVVCSFATRCHLDLKTIALEGANVEYKRQNGMVTMKLRKPYTTASMWSSGKITCTGATSEEEAKVASRKFARCLQRLGFKIRFCRFRIVNVLATCSMPFRIRIAKFSNEHKEKSSYEPELHPGVTYRISEPKATLKIFSTGSITITAPCVSNIQLAVEHIFPLVYPYRMEKNDHDVENDNMGGATFRKKHWNRQRTKRLEMQRQYKSAKDFEYFSGEEFSDMVESEEYDTDESFD
ncbi:TATA box-binding protein-like 1 [Tubulanus polymorphus]|uniref:TATA box-binding protein-like 1 n=1 Tax=Tubulanus polymorphus TaxID=672921 RepID=UPI003DA27FB3